MEDEKVIFDVRQIQEILLHRYPFLLIDKVLEIERGHRIVAVKNVTCNEPFFQGHFPGQPVMPGVLIMEAMAQAAAILLKVSEFENESARPILLVGATDFRWKKMVFPGDTLRITVVFEKSRKPLWIVNSEVTVGGKLVAKGNLSAVSPDKIEI